MVGDFPWTNTVWAETFLCTPHILPKGSRGCQTLTAAGGLGASAPHCRPWGSHPEGPEDQEE